MTTNTEKWQSRLTEIMDEIRRQDARGDVTLRNQAIARLLGDENGIPLAAARKALQEAGFGYAVK